MRSKLIFNDFTMTSADTMGGVTYRQTINSGTDLQYGCAAMAEVSFSFRTDNFDKGTVFKGQRFELQISQAESGEDYQTVGFFHVDAVNIKGGKTSVVAYDVMSSFDATADTFMAGIEYPITLYTLLQSLCYRAGVQLANESITNGDINISKKISLSGGTLRNLLSYIAAAAASYAYINPEGKLQLSEYTVTEISLNNTQYVSCWLAEYATDVISRVTLSTPDATVSVDNPDINIMGTTVNEYVVYDNPVINACSNRQSIAEGILEKVISLSYTPSEITLFCDHGINAGDIITVDGTTTVVMEKTMKSSGVTVSATGNRWRDLYVSNEEQKTVQNNYDASTAREEAEQVKESLGEYVKTSNLSASIDTYINSSAGTASIVAAVDGTYQKISDMFGYVQTTQLSAEIGQYIDSSSGTAKIISAASGTFATTDSLGNYVAKTELNTSIGQYIDSSSGTAKIISAASGTYQTISGMSNYATVSAVATIEQSVSDVESSITLSSSYTKNTIGTNVYALLQLVSNANSSSIKIKADKIDFTGFTTFLRASDLGSSGTTSIDGGRILTGTISADRIDTTDLYLQSLRTSTGEYIVGYLGNTLALGGGLTSSGTSFAEFSYVDIKVSNAIRIGYSTTACIFSYEDSHFVLRPYSSPVQLNIGSSLYPVGYIYSKYGIYVDGVALPKLTDIKRIYVTGSTSSYIQLNSSKAFVASGSGFALGTTGVPFSTLYIGTGSTYYWKFEAAAIIPSSTSTSYFNIGSSSVPVNNIYARRIFLNGTELTA